MEFTSKIYVAGHRGLVGSAIVRSLIQYGYKNIVTRTSQDVDLRDSYAVADFFQKEKPEYVFIAAAKVGGIYANDMYRADFLYDNIMIQSNIIHQSYKHGVKKLLFLGSSCIYPKFAPQPLREEYLLSGSLEDTNEAYAIAKITGIKMCESYRRQYGCNFISVMPTNIYGLGDNYHLQNSHVLPALIKKIHDAKQTNSPFVEIWGSGTPRREFLHADDLSDACIFLMNKYNDIQFVNIGTGVDLTITQLALLIKDIIGYNGDIRYDLTKPDGTPRKLLDVSLIHSLGWTHKIDLRTGIQQVYDAFKRESHVVII